MSARVNELHRVPAGYGCLPGLYLRLMREGKNVDVKITTAGAAQCSARSPRKQQLPVNARPSQKCPRRQQPVSIGTSCYRSVLLYTLCPCMYT